MNILEHRAVRAWLELRPASRIPRQIEILKEKKQGAVYRLAGIGPADSGIIAKRALREMAEKEYIVYEKVLPQLAVPKLQYYGCLEERDGRFCWLFLEDAGRQKYSPSIKEHRIQAGLWFGRLHSSAACLDLEVNLPDRGPSLYLTYLRSIIESVPRLEVFAALSANDQEVLTNIVTACTFLDARWDQIEGFCERLPRTFIHDDCLAKNVHVRNSPNGPAIAPFDWGGAGWGLPATDLGQLRLPYKDRLPSNPDIVAYHGVIREQWPTLEVKSIRRLVNLGQLFWSLKVISRSLPEFDYSPAHLEYVIYNFRIYNAILDDSVRLARLKT